MKKRLNEANELGDIKIDMEQGFCLEIFVDAEGDTESWRFFEINTKESHFIIFESN